MNIYIIRNNQQFGPYDEQTLVSYVNEGQILRQDKAIAVGETFERTVGYYLKRANLKTKVKQKGSIFKQLSAIGGELIFPHTTIFSKQFVSDQRFLILALVGLLPMLIMQIPFRGFLLFYEVSLYFSIIWGIFFYTVFKSPQVKLKTTLIVFFATQIFVFVIWNLFGLSRLNVFYRFTEYGFPLDIIGYILGVGLTEEFVKLLPLLIILRNAQEPLIPQTVVFYGLISGIAFGVFEGVEYQMGINAELEYDMAFFYNMARLTSLPFLHACWCGVAGYFLSFCHLYPKYRSGLFTLALTIPALIHGLYDSFASWPLLPLVLVFLGLMLLTIYLKQGVNYQSKLRN